MNHDEAIRLKAAEKYLLGELNAELRDQYEDHYFGCAECAQEVRTGAVFIDNARDVLGSGSVAVADLGAKHQPVRSGGWWTALLRPAFARGDQAQLGEAFVVAGAVAGLVGLAGFVRLAGLVAEVVGEAGEEVQVGQVPPVPGGQHAQRDREVLPGRVGHHIFGTRHRRADVLSHARPSGTARTSAAPSHGAIFQGMHKQLQTMTRASGDVGVGQCRAGC